MFYRSSRIAPTNRRPGVVLLVVMAMLALFASLALSFVFYADSQAVEAGYSVAAQSNYVPDIDPEMLAGYFLSKFIYGDQNNPYSAGRGWDLARSIYGYNPAALNATPYNGVGRSALRYTAPPAPGYIDPVLGDNYSAVNYQTFSGPGVNYFQRTPEFTGKLLASGAADPNYPYRYVGGANAPWTAYDTNSLFLAQVDATGNVYMPSFFRPWLAATAAAQPAPNQKYFSLFPDPIWNPAFYPLPDAVSDPKGLQVKNLDFGPGMNDSNWMDWGYPIMTAPDGKRYKPLFATLAVDMSNKLHLWAHGNPLGVSNMGFGPSDVNLNKLPGMFVNITAATHAGTAVKITTSAAHGLSVGQTVVISGVGVAGYNGIFPVIAPVTANTFHYTVAGALASPVPAASLGAAAIAANGQIFALRYGALLPTGAVPNLQADAANLYGYSNVDADGLNPTTKLSSRPFSLGIQTPARMSAAVNAPVPPAGVVRTVAVPPTGTTAGFPWYFFDLVTNAPATQLLVDQELVTVTAINTAANTFTARFYQPHLGGANGVKVSVNPNFGFPTYPSNWVASPSWGNADAAELANNPLAFNLYLPGAPNIAPLPMSNQEALLRFGGTNSPALTSEIFRRMPGVFNGSPAANPRTRNMVTLASWHFDRITNSPYLNFDRTTAGNYIYGNPANVPPLNYPTLVMAKNPAPVWSAAAPAVTSTSATTPPWKTEFSGSLSGNAASTDWRSNLGNFLRVDLNRPLTPYTTAASQAQALADRVQFATDIYNALVRVTGARDPNKPFVAENLPTPADYEAARWLAQLAVNIVDYVDNDTNMTAFPWHKTAAGGTVETVFGTELPRLVMNQVYAQQEAAPTGRVNVWAELLNPLPNIAANAVQLQATAAPFTPYYEIEIYASTPALSTWLRNPNNNLGAGFPSIAPAAATVAPLATLASWTPVPAGGAATTAVMTQVLPANPATPPNVVTKIIRPYAANVANTGAHEVGATVTIHTTTAHGLTQAADVGRAVTISGVVNNTGAPAVGYDGTFVITAVPTTTTFTYTAAVAGLVQGGSPAAPAAQATATFVLTGGNSGFYVVGPAQAQYPNTAAGALRVPPFPATLASPTMSVPIPSAIIATATHNAAGTTVTITTTAALPAGFAVGQKVVVAGVTTTAAAVAATGYNNTAANLFWTIAARPTATTLTFTVPAGTVFPLTPATGGTVSLYTPNITMLLRRLANPSLAYQPNPATVNPPYNPYITVDYLDQIPVAPIASQPTFLTSGRPQPYQASLLPPGQSPPFFQNAPPGGTPFDWLVHLDRPPVNPLELLHVSGYKPHELTQQFVTAAGKFQHYAPWNPFMAAPTANPNALIYRAFDSMSTRYMAGLYAGGRYPGNINLNTIMELEIFQALCDAHDASAAEYPNPWFTDAQVSALSGRQDVRTIFANMMTSRGVPNTAPPTVEPPSPFKSFSAASTVANQVSFKDTWFRTDPTNPTRPLFAVGSAASHPYLQSSLLQKIYNNTTTTSNVFAVWCTVGFFEVVDETVKPARLGQEIGRAQNKHIRHRFFAIVDRSGLQLANTTSTTAVTLAANAGVPQTLTVKYNATGVMTPTGPIAQWKNTPTYVPGNIVYEPAGANAVAYYCIKANTNVRPTTPLTAANSLDWQSLIQPGMLLEVGTGANTEVVAVTAVGATAASGHTITANFAKSHAAGVPIVIRGNPGPQTIYNPHDDPGVVLHMSVIK